MIKARNRRERKWWDEFLTRVTEVIVGAGGKKQEEYAGYPHYTVQTKAGTLRLTIFEDWVACKFVDVQAARDLLPNDYRLNRYSGKWNVHYETTSDVKACVAGFKRELGTILPNGNGA